MDNKELIEYLDKKFKAIDERFDKVEEQLNTVNYKLDRLENKAPTYVKNTDNLSHDIEYLSRKVGLHDMIIDRLSKQ